MSDVVLPPLARRKASVPVDVMPGQYDPTNYTLPQQPLHRCMFPLSSVYPTLQLVSNPYEANIDGVRWAVSHANTHTPSHQKWLFRSGLVSLCVGF